MTAVFILEVGYTLNMDWHEQNVKVYNDSAEEIAEYFRGIGPRIDDIERGLGLAGKKNGAKVIELGCGDGRDAAEIIPRAAWYEGIDPSAGLLRLARQKVPSGSFVCSDALRYAYPQDLDVIFAFASLLHISREDLPEVFKKARAALKAGGVFYMSLKEMPGYNEEVKEDQYGQRMFYYYTPALIEELAGGSFENVHEHHQTVGQTDWFTLALRKVG